MRKVLVKTYTNHIEGYNFLTDMGGSTIYGIPIQEVKKYKELTTTFKANPLLSSYKTGNLMIPRGTLKVYGIIKTKKEMKQEIIKELIKLKDQLSQHYGMWVEIDIKIKEYI
jgi:hypothetical protein